MAKSIGGLKVTLEGLKTKAKILEENNKIMSDKLASYES
jgi:hypothetical protein